LRVGASFLKKKKLAPYWARLEESFNEGIISLQGKDEETILSQRATDAITACVLVTLFCQKCEAQRIEMSRGKWT
jgi:hypothetical protein